MRHVTNTLYWIGFLATFAAFTLFIVLSFRAGYWVADSPDKGLLVGNAPVVIGYTIRRVFTGNQSLFPWR
jgi:hypothetical protein